jgi:G3E family GTPase
LKGSLLNAVEELRIKQNVEILVIEATGIAEPEEMIETFSDPALAQNYEIAPMVTVVDTPKFLKIREMLGPFYEAQVVNADTIILNKIDLAPASQLEAVKTEILALNSNASYVFAEQCEIDIKSLFFQSRSTKIEPTTQIKEKNISENQHEHRHAPASSLVLDASKDYKSADLEDFFYRLPESIWRVKGFLVIEGQPNLLQFSMGQLDLTPVEPRENYNLVFIGSKLDQGSLTNEFDTVSSR